MIIKYIEEKTENILRKLNMQEAPISPIKCAKKLGVDVNSIDMDDNISGLFVIKNGKAFIRYNKNQKNNKRNRFTIAHELGHYVLHKHFQLIIDKDRQEKVMYRDNNSSSGDMHREREANAFAASLLMPKFILEEEIEKIPKDVNIIPFLANKFKVSEQAMSIRLSNMGLLEYGLL